MGEKTGTGDVDVICHEYTHVISKYAYAPRGGTSQSAAIDEGLADLFGTLVEAYVLADDGTSLADTVPDWIMRGDHIHV